MHKLSKLIATSVMLISVLACSVSARITPSSTPPPKPTAQPTNTRLVQATEAPTEVQATSTSPSQPTKTKVAPKAATPTPTLAGRVTSTTGPTRTTPPTLSASALQACLDALPGNMPTVEQMVTSGNTQGAHPLVLCDNFADNSNGWSVGDFNGNYVQGTESIAKGVMHWQGIAPNGGVWYDFSSNSPTVSDFAVVVSARILDGPPDTTVGIFYRSDGDQFYLFEVSATQYDLYLFYSGKWEELIAPKPVPAGFDLASKNGWIVVDVVGNLHTFYLDNGQVDMFTDSRLTSGQVGVGMDLATDPNVKGNIEFYHFVLRGE